MRKILLLCLIIISSGCYSRKAHFIQHGYESYPAKPDNYEVIVFDREEEPDREYTVIGLVVVDSKSGLIFSGMTTYEKIIELLKKEALKHGADAIMDIQIQKDTDLVQKNIDLDPDADIIDIESTKRIEAKAIVFE